LLFGEKLKSIILSVLCIVLLTACGGNNESTNAHPPADELEKAFVTPPESVQTAVYWYWISGHVSKEGVVKDLYSMKEAGINRAFIGNIYLEGIPSGEVKVFSDEWWGILHLALKTATELDIEIGIFNSPGWSQSGGPWVKADNAMRYLASSETRVKGPVTLSRRLEKPIELFQDVRVVAYPASMSDGLVLDSGNSSVSSQPEVSGLAKILDGDQTTGVTFPVEDTFTIDIQAIKEFSARSLSIRSVDIPMKAEALFQARNKNGEFTTVKTFEIDRSNPSLNVGFVPYAPVVVSFPAITSSDFRLLVTHEDPSDWYMLRKRWPRCSPHPCHTGKNTNGNNKPKWMTRHL